MPNDAFAFAAAGGSTPGHRLAELRDEVERLRDALRVARPYVSRGDMHGHDLAIVDAVLFEHVAAPRKDPNDD